MSFRTSAQGGQILFSVRKHTEEVPLAYVKREDGTISRFEFEDRQVMTEAHGMQVGTDWVLGKGHRDAGPSYVQYDEQGRVVFERWERNGKDHKPSAHEMMTWKREQAAYIETIKARREKDGREVDWGGGLEEPQITSRADPDKQKAAVKAAAARIAGVENTPKTKTRKTQNRVLQDPLPFEL